VRKSDKQLGRPSVPYTDTKAAIEALSNPKPGWIVFAADTGQFGFYTDSWTWGNLGGGGGAVFVDQSGGTPGTFGVLVGAIDGVNTTFTVSYGEYLPGSLQVFLNGQLLAQGIDEAWVELSPGRGTFMLNESPVAGDIITAIYQTRTSVTGSGDRIDQSDGLGDTYGVLTGAIDGANTSFIVSAGVYVSGMLKVYLNGQLLTQGTYADWVETDPSTGLFDFVVSPVVGDRITVGYKVPGSGSGDADTLDGLHAEDILSGWVGVSDIWTYASTDGHVFSLYVSGDVTAQANYKLGNKVWCQNNGADFFGFIVLVDDYDSANNRTQVYLYGGTDFSLSNSAITAPFISKIKSPDGFPLEPDKWSEVSVHTDWSVLSTYSTNVFYGGSLLTPTGPSIDVPIGLWRPTTKAICDFETGSGGTGGFRVTLMDSETCGTNEESDPEFTMSESNQLVSSTRRFTYVLPAVKLLSATTKKTYYIGLDAGTPNFVELRIAGTVGASVIKLECAYL
jgi:hypothetical protein